MHRLAVWLVTAGCVQTQATSPAGFVADIHVDGNALAVSSCTIVQTTTDALLIRDPIKTLDTSGCHVERVPVPAADDRVLAAPEACRDAIVRWRATSDDPDPGVWDAMSPACRAYVEVAP